MKTNQIRTLQASLALLVLSTSAWAGICGPDPNCWAIVCNSSIECQSAACGYCSTGYDERMPMNASRWKRTDVRALNVAFKCGPGPCTLPGDFPERFQTEAARPKFRTTGP
jgi:hypothetical protein